MKKYKVICILAFMSCLMTLSEVQVFAIPGFARKYGFNCEMCHVAWPALNDFGQKFRMNGYQIPGDEQMEKRVFEYGSTFVMRTAAGYTADSFTPEGSETEVSQFQLKGLDMLAGGTAGPNKGFFVGYVPAIAGGSGVQGQEGELEQANVIMKLQSKDKGLTIRLGRMEAAYLPFSRLRSITTSPYEIYAFNGSPDISAAGTRGSLNTFSMADTANGVEVSDFGRPPWQYALGVVNGSRENYANDGPGDVYLRAARVVGRGLGQTTGQRLGAMVYLGQARAMTTGARERFSRVGFDANLNKGPNNVQFEYLIGQENGAFNVFSPGNAYKFTGGFVQVNNYGEAVTKFLRADWVNTPSEDGHDILRITGGLRKQLEYGMMLHLEYSHRRVKNGAGAGSNLDENYATAAIDWAF